MYNTNPKVCASPPLMKFQTLRWHQKERNDTSAKVYRQGKNPSGFLMTAAKQLSLGEHFQIHLQELTWLDSCLPMRIWSLECSSLAKKLIWAANALANAMSMHPPSGMERFNETLSQTVEIFSEIAHDKKMYIKQSLISRVMKLVKEPDYKEVSGWASSYVRLSLHKIGIYLTFE